MRVIIFILLALCISIVSVFYYLITSETMKQQIKRRQNHKKMDNNERELFNNSLSNLGKISFFILVVLWILLIQVLRNFRG